MKLDVPPYRDCVAHDYMTAAQHTADIIEPGG
jgi:hypothetical protein